MSNPMGLDYPGTQPKSDYARALAQATLADLSQHPLGTGRGENFSVPSNYRIPPARIYVVNHSATRAWKRVVIPVSELHGAEEAIIADKELAKVYNVDTLTRQVEKGKDMNRYKTEVFPVAFALRIPGGGSRIIPPAKSKDDKPIAVEIPDGTWDLYLGNYDRMQGYAGIKSRDEEKFDPLIKADEENRFAVSWRQRYNPVFRVTDDGETTERNNPHGFLEFVRVTQRAVLEPIDREYLNALDIIEV